MIPLLTASVASILAPTSAPQCEDRVVTQRDEVALNEVQLYRFDGARMVPERTVARSALPMPLRLKVCDAEGSYLGWSSPDGLVFFGKSAFAKGSFCVCASAPSSKLGLAASGRARTCPATAC